MKKYGVVVALALVVILAPYKALAGVENGFTRNSIDQPNTKQPLSCSCSSGEYEEMFYNMDTITLTLIGDDGWHLTLNPGESGSHFFTDPGVYHYHVDGYSSTAGQVTIINQGPSFPDGSKLVASADYTSVSLNWPSFNDDGPEGHYNLYQNDSLIRSDGATGMTVTGLAEGVTYTFKVDGYDLENLKTPTSLSATVTTNKHAVVSSPTPTKIKAVPAPVQSTTSGTTTDPSVSSVAPVATSGSSDGSAKALATNGQSPWYWVVVAVTIAALGGAGGYWYYRQKKIKLAQVKPENETEKLRINQ